MMIMATGTMRAGTTITATTRIRTMVAGRSISRSRCSASGALAVGWVGFPHFQHVIPNWWAGWMDASIAHVPGHGPHDEVNMTAVGMAMGVGTLVGLGGIGLAYVLYKDKGEDTFTAEVPGVAPLLPLRQVARGRVLPGHHPRPDPQARAGRRQRRPDLRRRPPRRRDEQGRGARRLGRDPRADGQRPLLRLRHGGRLSSVSSSGRARRTSSSRRMSAEAVTLRASEGFGYTYSFDGDSDGSLRSAHGGEPSDRDWGAATEFQPTLLRGGLRRIRAPLTNRGPGLPERVRSVEVDEGWTILDFRRRLAHGSLPATGGGSCARGRRRRRRPGSDCAGRSHCVRGARRLAHGCRRPGHRRGHRDSCPRGREPHHQRVTRRRQRRRDAAHRRSVGEAVQIGRARFVVEARVRATVFVAKPLRGRRAATAWSST